MYPPRLSASTTARSSRDVSRSPAAARIPLSRSRSLFASRREQLADHRVAHLVVDRARTAPRVLLGRDVGVERDDVAGPCRAVDVQVRDETVLIAAVPDQLDAVMPLDERRQAGLDVLAAAAFAVAGAKPRGEHLVDRRTLQDALTG